MSSSCCTAKVKPIKDGYALEIKGKGVTEECGQALKQCCSGQDVCDCRQPSAKDRKSR